MSRRGENIYKRKDGRWEGRYIKCREPQGRIHYGYIYSYSYKETKNKLLLKKYEFRNIQATNSPTYYPGTVQNFSHLCIEQWQQNVKESTIDTYRYKLTKYVFPVVGHLKLSEVKRSHIQKMVHHWKRERLAPRTVHSLFQLVKRLFQQAFQKKQIPRDPCQEIALPEKESKKIVPLSLKEQRQLEAAAEHEKNGEAILLGSRLGLRIGEISALKWRNIDFEKKQLHVTETYQRLYSGSAKTMNKTRLAIGSAKTKSSQRTLPLTNQMCDLLERLRQRNRSEYVFQSKGKPMEPRLLTYYFHKIREKAGLTNIHFHQLRHTFATRLLEVKGTISSISELLGHRSTQMTLDIYTGTVFEEKHRSLEEMERAV